MNDVKIIDLTPDNIADYGVCGYKDVNKHKELRNKIGWFKEYYSKGLRIKVIVSEKGGYQGMLEYIPGEFAHRPVNADGYMFIHCIFVGFKSEFKGKGYASSLIDKCINEARNERMSGVAVVTRKGSFMANDEIFLKKGFDIVDSAEPDFNLLAIKFDKNSVNPSFRTNMLSSLGKYKIGVTIIRSVQCPYTEKNVNAILDTAIKKYNLKVNLVDLKDSESAQDTPCAFGTFCIIYNGEVISYHPISNTRFENIMNKMLEKAQ
ncbi:MAG: GNAT family N-acetyltransferase [Bacteroidetes bacterium GWF2_40_14]|nr:MAG: GNAT family N-acetyltransferase [Bacteroidetes bacterium GWF2_40_14]